MTDIATLSMKIDASQVTPAAAKLEELAKAGAKAETQTNKLSISTDQAERYMRKASVVLGDLKAKEEAAALAATKLSQAQASVSAAGQRVTASASAQKAGMQQLGYQLNDVASGFAMGQKPMQIWAQQGSQVIQSITLMAGAGGRLAGFLTGPWGVAISVASVALVPLIGKLFDTSAALQQVRADANDAIKALNNLGSADIGQQIAKASGELGRLTEQRDKLLKQLQPYGFKPGMSPDNSAVRKSGGSGLAKEYYDLQQSILAAQNAIGQGNKALDEQAAKMDKASKATDKASGSSRAHTSAIKADKAAVQSFTQAFRPYEEAMDSIKNAAEEARQKEQYRIDALHKGMEDLNASAERYNDTAKEMSDTVDQWLKNDAEAAQLLNDQFRDMIDLLQNVGGLGKGLGALLGLATGNYSSIGGTLGQILNQGIGTTTDASTGKIIAVKIGDELRDVFGLNGAFGQTLSTIIPQIGVAMAAQDLVGGTLSKLLGLDYNKTAGNFFGVIGGFLAPMLFGKKPPSGTATISNGSVSTSGNDADRKQAATDMAGAVNDGLKSIASQLGTGLGDYLVSIGVYKDQYRVNFSGAAIHGDKTGANGDRQTYATEAEAVAAAIRDAVKDGAIKGLSAGAKALILAAGDINEQVSKALKFDQVFKDVAAATNPFKAAMDDLATQMTDLTAIFNEAGASAQDLATLQEWLLLKQQALIEQANSSYRSTFYTTDQNVAYAKQTISSTLTPLGLGNVDTVAEYKALVEATDAIANPELYGTLMNLSDEFGVLKDAAEQAAQTADAAAAAEKALAQQRASINIQILQAQGKTEEALAATRAAELAAADESLRADLKRLYAAQDIATAQDAVSEAYKREKSALEDTIDAADKAASSLKDYRDSLNGTGDAALTTRAAMLKFMQVGGSASGTGADALTAAGNLPGAGNDYLSALKNSAGSYLEYARGEALVKQYTNRAIAAAEGQKSDAQRQLEQMTAQVNALGVNTDATVSLTDAIAKLNSLLSPSSPGTPSTPGGGQGNNGGGRDNHDREERERHRWDRQHAANTAIVEQLGALNARFRRYESPDGTGINIRTSDDLPLVTTPAA